MSSEPEKQSAGGWLAGGGILSGLAASIGASCCVLPVILAQLGVSAALIAQLGAVARAKPYFLGSIVLLVAAGFLAAFRGGRRPRPLVLAMLIGAAILVAAAIVFPRFEPQILNLLRPS